MTIKTHLHLALFLVVIPDGAIASPNAQRNYAQFELTNAEEIALAKLTTASCPKKSGGPKYQAKCREKLVAQSDAHLDVRYERTMARLSTANREVLREEQRTWIQERDTECYFADKKPYDISGTPGDIPMFECMLRELKRRTLWIDRYPIGTAG